MIDYKRLLERFLAYVQIDSETGFEREMQDRVLADLRAAGIFAETDDVGAQVNSTGNNIYCRLQGDDRLAPIVFSAHIDTVTPGKGIKPKLENGILKSDGSTILGGDDKCGVAAIVETLVTLAETKAPHRTVEGVFTIREESSLLGAKHFDASRLQARMGVVLDSGGDVGTVVVTAPGQLKINACVIGKPAHAGMYPERGISAIQVAAHAISNMKLLRIDEETTANIGTVKAESPTNIVPERCVLHMEARSLDYAKLVAQGDHMKACLQEACDQFGATLECDISTAYIGYKTDETTELFRLVTEKLADMGIAADRQPTGGGSDANIFRQKGIEMLNLGVGMDKVHSREEQLELRQLELTAELLYRLARA